MANYTSAFTGAQIDQAVNQVDTRTDLTPADGATATVNFATGKAWKITAPDTGAGMDFVIDLTNWPAGSVFAAVEVMIIVGTNIPTISYKVAGSAETPNGTVPTLSASMTHIWIISSWDAGASITIDECKRY